MNNEKTLVFVSIPVNDGEDKHITERRLQIAKAGYLRQATKNIKDVAFVHRQFGDDATQLSKDTNAAAAYLAEAIDQIAKCDLVYFAKGWQNNTACMIEMVVCLSYEVPHMEA